jgi:hypothetical protein
LLSKRSTARCKGAGIAYLSGSRATGASRAPVEKDNRDDEDDGDDHSGNSGTHLLLHGRHLLSGAGHRYSLLLQQKALTE